MRIRICLAFDWELALYTIHVYFSGSALGFESKLIYNTLLMIFSERGHGQKSEALIRLWKSSTGVRGQHHKWSSKPLNNTICLYTYT